MDVPTMGTHPDRCWLVDRHGGGCWFGVED